MGREKDEDESHKRKRAHFIPPGSQCPAFRMKMRKRMVCFISARIATAYLVPSGIIRDGRALRDALHIGIEELKRNFS